MPQIIVQRDGAFHSDSVFSGVDYLLIGRARTSDIHLSDPTHRVSRHHAAIVRAPGNADTYFVRDLGSLRSTRVFGRTVSQHILREGDVIEIADYELIYSAREHPGLDTNPLRVVPLRQNKGAVDVCTVALSSYGICHDLKLTDRQRELIESIIQAGREGMKPTDIFVQMIPALVSATDARRGFACLFRNIGDSGLEVLARSGMKATEQIDITDANYLVHLRNGRPVMDDRTILVPILQGEESLGFVCLDRAPFAEPFYSEEAEFLTMLGHVATSRSRSVSFKSSRIPEVRTILDWPCEMVGNSEGMTQLRKDVSAAAAGDINVLVLGENGTGKELVARAIHAAGPTKSGPFLARNCAALTETLAETEIFGYARRSGINGANPEGSPGWFEQACGGSLLLDEIQGLTVTLQDKFLRVLQDKHVLRVQERTAIPVKVKIIAATDKDLNRAIETGEFRKAFYFRFGKIIRLPPLRERKEDIPLLTFYFLDRYASRMKSPIRTVSYRALQKLLTYEWPGNVRQLENAVQSAISKAPDREFLFSWDFPDEVGDPPLHSGAIVADSAVPVTENPVHQAAVPVARTMAEVERAKIVEALEATHGNISRAGRLLGYRSRQTMLNKMDKYLISRDCGDVTRALED